MCLFPQLLEDRGMISSTEMREYIQVRLPIISNFQFPS